MAEAVWLRSMAADLGCELYIHIHTDSSAAVGMCRRTGVGRVRHLAVGQFWIQDKARKVEVRLYKTFGHLNPADALAKAVAQGLIQQDTARVCLDARQEWLGSAPNINMTLTRGALSVPVQVLCIV